MSKKYENMLKAMNKHLEQCEPDNFEEEVKKALVDGSPTFDYFEPKDEEGRTVEDYLDLADEARSKKKRLEYLHKALKIDPDDLDIMRAIAEEETEGRPVAYITRLEELIAVGDEQMRSEGLLDECIGSYWGIIETRPYMRLLYTYMNALSSAGMKRRAIKVGERMLLLCKNDNPGTRYYLMHLYAYFEEEAPMKKLHKKFGGYDETQMLLPLSIVCYKKGDLENALTYLKRLEGTNKDTKLFIDGMYNGDIDEVFFTKSPGIYRPRCFDELMYAVRTYTFLYTETFSYFFWAHEMLKKRRGKRASRE